MFLLWFKRSHLVLYCPFPWKICFLCFNKYLQTRKVEAVNQSHHHVWWVRSLLPNLFEVGEHLVIKQLNLFNAANYFFLRPCHHFMVCIVYDEIHQIPLLPTSYCMAPVIAPATSSKTIWVVEIGAAAYVHILWSILILLLEFVALRYLKVWILQVKSWKLLSRLSYLLLRKNNIFNS